jgi:N6-adenosine-specific RNA methylase IME4
MYMQLKINEKFKNLIPTLDPAEYQQLEANILKHGLLDPIKVTQDQVIIDGHNRYAICQLHNIAPKIEIINFADEAQAVIWTIDNQLGRRNITDFVKIELLQQKKQLLEKLGTENNKGFGGKPTKMSKIDKPLIHHRTRSIIAAELNWSEGKVAMAQKILTVADEQTKQQLRAGELSINQAYKELRRAELKADFNAKIEQQKQSLQNLPAVNGLYDVVVIDPPWDYGAEYDSETRRGAAPYPCMSLEEIEQITIPAKDDAVIWLWTTQKFLYPAFNLLNKWGLQYRAILTWNKEKLGLGYWLRYQCEYCLLATKGSPLWNNTSYRDYIAEYGREHSRKPEAFYKMLDNICYGAKIDYFSRTQREGWAVYGNDINKFTINNQPIDLTNETSIKEE